MQLLIISAMLIAACGVVFAMQNDVPVTVTFLLWRFDSSLAMVLLLALAIGGIIVALASTPSTLRRQWMISRLNKRVAQLEKSCAEQKHAANGQDSYLPASESVPAAARKSEDSNSIYSG